MSILAAILIVICITALSGWVFWFFCDVGIPHEKLAEEYVSIHGPQYPIKIEQIALDFNKYILFLKYGYTIAKIQGDCRIYNRYGRDMSDKLKYYHERKYFSKASKKHYYY